MTSDVLRTTERSGALSRRDILKASVLSGAGALLGPTRAFAQSSAPIIDSQVHAYERNHPGRPWAQPFEGPTEVTGDQMVAAMDTVGVDAAVLVSVYSIYRYDASYAKLVYAKYPQRIALVTPIDTADPAAAEAVAAWKATKGAIAVRVLLMPGAAPDDAADPGIDRVLAAAAKHALPVNVQCRGRLGQVAELARRHPNTSLVVDHLGLEKPTEPPVPPNPWADLPKLLALAAYPNVALKTSGVCTVSHRPFPYDDIWEPLSRIFDAFGVNRCMWGTDWTRSLKLLSYRQAVDAFRATPRLSDSDRAMFMGGTLGRVYNWSPSKA